MEGFEVTTLADPSVAVERIRDEGFPSHHARRDDAENLRPRPAPRIRVVDRSIPVIVMTSYRRSTAYRRRSPTGSPVYIGHPLTVPELREAIRRGHQEQGLHAAPRRSPACRDRHPDSLPPQGARLDPQASGAPDNLSARSCRRSSSGAATPSVSDLCKIAARSTYT